jgi:hypothetical protein
MFSATKASDMKPKDFQLFLDPLFRLVENLDRQGIITDSQAEKSRVEEDLRFFFRDDKSTLYRYILRGEFVGVVGVRIIDSDMIYVHQMVLTDDQWDRGDILCGMVQGLQTLYPYSKAYGVLHQSNEALRGFISSLGLQESKILYEDEHPSMISQGGWMAWLHIPPEVRS